MEITTREWKNRGRFFSDEFLQEVRLLIAFACTNKDIQICGWDGTGEATITNRLISLNGCRKDNLDAQTFTLESDYKKSPKCYCKTNGRPYDAVVSAILIKAMEYDYIYDMYPSRANSLNGETLLKDYNDYKNHRSSIVYKNIDDNDFTEKRKEVFEPVQSMETSLINDLGFFEQLLIEYKEADDLEDNIKSLLIAMYTNNESSFFGELYNLNKLYLDSSLEENDVRTRIPLTHTDLIELLTNYPDEILTKITRSESPANVNSSEYVILNTNGTFSPSTENEYIEIAKSNLLTIFANNK